MFQKCLNEMVRTWSEMHAHKHYSLRYISRYFLRYMWNVIDEMTTVTASECVCVGVKLRANKEGGKSEKEKDREERAALWMLHIFCGSHNHNLSIQRFRKSWKSCIIFTEITFLKISKHPYKNMYLPAKLHRLHVMEFILFQWQIFFTCFIHKPHIFIYFLHYSSSRWGM